MDAPLDLHTVFSTQRFGDAELQLKTLGVLVHHGRIVGSDPLTHSELRPFARVFPPGAHPVEVVIHRARNDERVAFARVLFSAVAPATFELAIRDGENPRALSPEQVFGYGVDAGTGCFAVPGAQEDASAAALLADLDANSRISWAWAVAKPAKGGHQLVAFSSGFGDGVYATYVGLDAWDVPVCLVTDFRCVPVVVPRPVEDPGFRHTHVDATYERMKQLVSQLGGPRHGEAYGPASELRSMTGDAVHLTNRLIGDLRGTRNEMERDLYLVVLTELLSEPAAQRIVAPYLSSLPVATTQRLVVATPSVDPAWLAALRGLWSIPALRAQILAAEVEATEEDEITMAHAAETLGSDDPALVAIAVAAFRGTTAHAPTVLENLRAVVHSATEPSTRLAACRILSDAGDDLAELCASPALAVRLAAAAALNRKTLGRGDATLRAIVEDSAVDIAERFEAAGNLRDRAAQIDAYARCGLAGHTAAPIQLRYLGGVDAIAALERLVAEAGDDVKREAVKYLAVTRKLLAPLAADDEIDEIDEID